MPCEIIVRATSAAPLYIHPQTPQTSPPTPHHRLPSTSHHHQPQTTHTHAHAAPSRAHGQHTDTIVRVERRHGKQSRRQGERTRTISQAGPWQPRAALAVPWPPRRAGRRRQQHRAGKRTTGARFHSANNQPKRNGAPSAVVAKRAARSRSGTVGRGLGAMALRARAVDQRRGPAPVAPCLLKNKFKKFESCFCVCGRISPVLSWSHIAPPCVDPP